MQEQYWATKPPEEIIEELTSRVQAYDKHLESSGILAELRDSFKTFYGDSTISDVGSQGELKAIRINHYASLIRNLVSLVTNNKPAWQPVASNSDSASQSSSILAVGLLDYYMKDRRLDRIFRDACMMSCFLREAWIATTWDTQQGEVVAVDAESQTQVHEGDLKYSLFQLNDVIRDFNNNASNQPWIITREYINRWDLKAQFPEYAEKIGSISMSVFDINKTRISNQNYTSQLESDQIPFFTFYFNPSSAIPNGRMVTFIEGQVLTDGPMPYNKIPLNRLSAENRFESPFAHSPMMDVLPLNKAIDTMASILLTNNQAFGVQNVQYPKGGSVEVSQISGGMNLIQYDPKVGKLEPLQLTASAPETYKFFDMLVSQSQILSGINDSIRGQAPAGTSGAALALLSQQAIQFANGLQQGYVAIIEDTGTMSIQLLQKFANNKRTAILVGKHNAPLMKEWSSEDLKGISRITIESGNALSKTSSGKLTMADSLLQSGMLKRPEQYISVLTTGQLDSIYENEQSQLNLIR